MEYPAIYTLPNNPELEGMAHTYTDIVYSTATGTPLKLALLLPWKRPEDAPDRPCIVFVQGSAWKFPDIGYELAQLGAYAQEGYAVATLTHRSCLDGNPFPAFLQDVKTGIRFLRAHAEEYGIDRDRICIWGTSSGGNTALLVGVTGDDPEYKTGEYAEESDAVCCVIDCFGPSDLAGFMREENLTPDESNIFYQLTRGLDIPTVAKKMSPYRLVEDGKAYPPFLLIHGDADEVVPYSQSEKMYRRLCDAGVDARMIRIVGAPHEGNFWSWRLHDMIFDFLAEKL